MAKSPSSNPLTKRSGFSINLVLTLVVIVLAVLIIGAVLIFKGNGGGAGNNPQTDSQHQLQGPQAPAELLQRPDSNVAGQPGDGKVKLVEFFDFQCPSCGMMHPITKQLEQKYQGRVTFVKRNFPLPMHPNAMPAAQAAEAAGNQGKYEQMHDMLFEKQQEWSSAPNGAQVFAGYAQSLGLDMSRYNQDVNSPAAKNKIEQDKKDAQQVGVQGTPTFYLNGRQMELRGQTEQQITDDMSAYIDAELKR